MSERKIVYTYHPREGEFVTGVPARDLTQADVDRAGSDFMRIAEGSGMYQPVKPAKPSDDEKAGDAGKGKGE